MFQAILLRHQDMVDIHNNLNGGDLTFEHMRCMETQLSMNNWVVLSWRDIYRSMTLCEYVFAYYQLIYDVQSAYMQFSLDKDSVRISTFISIVI